MGDKSNGFLEVLLGSGVIFTGTVVGRILALGAHILIVQSLTPSSFGRISLAYTIVTLFLPFVLFGNRNGVTRMISSTKDFETKIDFARVGYIIVIITGVVGMTFIISFHQEISILMNQPDIAIYLFWFAPVLFLKPISVVTIAVIRGFRSSLGAILSRDILPQLVAIAAFLSATLILGPLRGAVIYWIAISIGSILAGFYFLRQHLSLRQLFQELPGFENLDELFSHSWPLALEGGFMVIMTRVDLITIGFFSSEANVGYYRSIQPLALVTLFVLNSFVFLYLPVATEHFENGEIKKLRQLYSRTTKWIILASAPLFIVFTIFTNDIVRIFLSQSYLPASTPFAILLIGMFIRVAVGPNGATIKAINRTRLNLASSFIGVVVNLGFNILLVPTYGMIGAAVATSIGFLSYNATELIVLYSTYRLQPFSYDLLKSLVPLTFTGIVLYTLRPESKSLISLLILGVILTAWTVIISLLTDSVDISEIKSIVRSMTE